MKSLIYILILIPNLCLSQVWTFEKGENPFDGKYRTAHTTANKGEFPYHRSKLVINLFNNNNISVYITGAGYFQSFDNLQVLWAFGNEPNVIYRSRYSNISKDGNTIFFEGIYTSKPYTEYNKLYLIEKLKYSDSVNVRLENSYGKSDVSYSLEGSKNAIDFVFENFVFDKKHYQK